MEQQPYQEAAPTEHLLDDISYSVIQAGSGKRFLNLLLDSIAYYLLYRFILFHPLVLLLTSVLEHGGNMTEIYALSFLSSYTFNLLYYTAFEAFTGGKTPAKYLTGTVAVNEDGTRISPRTAVLRSLIRLIPVEVFSGLGSPCYPWHDRWTRTYVADERESSFPPAV